MKIFLSVFVCFALTTSMYAQTALKESERISTFCKVWGFLKYYHPVVAEGKIDWDKEFMTRVKIVSKLESKEETSLYYSEWIKSLGEIKVCKNCTTDVPDNLKFNFDLSWIADTTLFTGKLSNELKYLQKNRNQGKNYYVQQYKNVGNTGYKNEKPYKDSIYPSAEMRLLSLSRYWNIIEYFYPYKYQTDQDWNEVLVEMIPKFKDAVDTTSYHLAMLELTAKINDSHAGLVTYHTNNYFGFKWAPFSFKIIDNKAIVTSFYNDSLCLKNDIQHGDLFLKVDDLSIEEIVKNKSKYIGSSNKATQLRDFYYAIFNGQTDSVKVSFDRNGVVSEKYIYRYYFRDFNYNWWSGKSFEPYKILDSNIGYVDMGLLQIKEVEGLVEKLKNTTSIIFDVRNYPNGTMYQIAYFLKTESSPFVKFTEPDLSYPGVFNYTESMNCGKKNELPYKGKIIVLCNEDTQSHAEFTIMALQSAPNVTVVGSQTAGADGNVSIITFPGGFQTYMTGIGVYYPDGRETQRIGIVPDIEVSPTIEGIRMKKDEVLEKAIEVINSN